MSAVTTTDVTGDANSKVVQHIRNVSKSIGTYDKRIHAQLLYENDSHYRDT